MNILPEDYVLMSDTEKEGWDHAQACMLELEKHFTPLRTNKPRISHFYILASKRAPIHFSAWEIRKNQTGCKLCLVQYDFPYVVVGRYKSHTEWNTSLYFLGYLKLKNDFGIALIKPETLADKVSELFEPVEIDFPSHPLFSFKYYVLARDRETFRQMVTPGLMAFMQKQSGLQLEFRHNQCLFRMPKTTRKNEAVMLAEIGLALDGILNG